MVHHPWSFLTYPLWEVPSPFSQCLVFTDNILQEVGMSLPVDWLHTHTFTPHTHSPSLVPSLFQKTVWQLTQVQCWLPLPWSEQYQSDFRMFHVTVLEFQLCHKYITVCSITNIPHRPVVPLTLGTTVCSNSFCWLGTVPIDKTISLEARTCSKVAVWY